ncbi:vWA domain-containing protein [Bradymonas sediminis]|uniref:Uncharacterized protein n=1 Tax=Bradymonas sediminis TaxID=1548548 RepID=A0A2Z4FM22_9DELT|nr:vWA domain-containing protein [Bradymonas sediminis]AWV90029.1 hypothetical protein DN745_12035 [Bradymonas sediminis]TDP76013.1 putative metal-binding protein [Bradymonas sediminis]
MSRWIKYSSAVSSLLVSTILAAPAFAWDFDDPTCAPTETFETENIPVPQVMLMLDQSGSMDDDNKWEDAINAIDSLTADMTQSTPDELRFGLGLFTTNSTGSELRIEIEVEAAENTHADIMNVLNAENPGGGTPIGSAILAMKDSQTIQASQGAAAGILITDGEPNRGSYGTPDELRDFAVEAACAHRDVAPLYVVGFGDGTDENFNNVTAAAGGTGSCDNGDPCAPGSHQYDASHWDGHCEGSIQADNSTALENALNQLADEIACTFDIATLTGNPTTPEWEDPAQGCTNYDCLKIQLNGNSNSGSNRIFHEDSTMTPQGWKWASSSRTQVRLLGNYCVALRNGSLAVPDAPDIEVTRACMCVAPTGNDCAGSDMVPAPGTCECPVGTWTCNQGTDVCMPKSQCGQPLIGEGDACDNGQLGVCAQSGQTVCDSSGALDCSAQRVEPPETPEITCDGLDNDCNGVVDDVVWQGDLCNPATMEATGPGPLPDNAVTSRCDMGEAFCVNAVAQCEALGPMPEVCNGIDDDCDGSVDNLNDSWQDSDFENMSLEGRYAPAACYQSNVCVCPNGPDTVSGATFEEYLEGWANGPGEPDPSCICGSGINP